MTQTFHTVTRVLSLAIAHFLVYSCSFSGSGPGNSEEGPASQAGRFVLEEGESFTKLTIINPWQGATGTTQVWYLIPSGSEPPAGITPDEIIFVPVRKIICMSSTHISMISALGREETIVGVSGAGFLFEPGLIDRFEKGLIRDVGYEDNLNKELILSLSPDLIMVYGVGSESLAYLHKLKELGVKVMFNADYLESDPLGKAEWIRLFGALYCCSDKAGSIFSEISENYNRLSRFIMENAGKNPDVMLGLPFRDTWFISPGNSYISRLISDAGGNYLWKETLSPVSMPMGLENVYIRALKADIWLNPGSASSRDEIVAVDPRLAKLPCFINGSVYNNNNRINGRGANDYWESGTMNPHILLRDLAAIMHPDLMGDTALFYYRKVE